MKKKSLRKRKKRSRPFQRQAPADQVPPQTNDRTQNSATSDAPSRPNSDRYANTLRLLEELEKGSPVPFDWEGEARAFAGDDRDIELANIKREVQTLKRRKPQLEQNPTPGEKIANPQRYPVLTVAEAAKLFRVWRSTIYRWIEEGKLERASLGLTSGKRGKVLILTQSAAKLLQESSE